MRRHSKAGRPRPIPPTHVILKDGTRINPSHVVVLAMRYQYKFEILWEWSGPDLEPVGGEIELGSSAAEAKRKAQTYVKNLKLISVDWDRFRPGEQIFKVAI